MISRVAAGTDLWKLIGTGDAEIRARLLDARHRIAQIVVLYQRGARQLLQLFVFENLEPLEVGERLGLRRAAEARARENSRAPETAGRA